MSEMNPGAQIILVFLILSLLPAGCSFTPELTDTQLDCSVTGICPEGFYCPRTGLKICQTEGNRPPARDAGGGTGDERVGDAGRTADPGMQDAGTGDGPATPDAAGADAGECRGGETKTCYDGPEGTMDRGICRAGRSRCAGEGWGLCEGQSLPAVEACDNVDNDCDGVVDLVTRQCSTACGQGVEICMNGSWVDCNAPLDCPCQPGDVDRSGCGDCGSRTRQCEAGGIWGPWGECGNEGDCRPDVQENSGCGNCGRMSRTCLQTCSWGEWSGCQGEGECRPDSIQDGVCGACGVARRACGQDCAWGEWGACVEGGQCTPDQVEEERCERCGRRERTCGENCMWSDWIDCDGRRECEEGERQCEGCGDCGERCRTCNSDCWWDHWTDCGGEGVCSRSATEQQNCGFADIGECRHGTQSRTCGDNCQWSEWGSCDGGEDPDTEVCDGLDNDCDGATDIEDSDMIRCRGQLECIDGACRCWPVFIECGDFCCDPEYEYCDLRGCRLYY